MTEDEIYRTSTQYRIWSFTEGSLASLRSTTNSLAATRVKAAIQRAHSEDKRVEKDGAGGGRQSSNDSDVDCLTVEEEQKLVAFYCLKAIDFADFCDFPTNVKATAVQYLKRFYLSNSPMTYHPKQMMPSALFLSTKTENHYTSLKTFVSKLPKTTADDVIAPEFLLTQGLRFTFDVRHPQRGLEGGSIELMALATGTYQSTPDASVSPKNLQGKMLRIGPIAAMGVRTTSVDDIKSRILKALGKAKEILKTSAILTDAYFLYTPSQIWLATLLIADEPLALFYLDVKLPGAAAAFKAKVIITIRECAALLRSSVSGKPGEAEMKELTRIDKKLYKCRNPEKMDLIGINKAQKREGEGKDEDGLDEKIVKKRKLERESGLEEGESLFGPVMEK